MSLYIIYIYTIFFCILIKIHKKHFRGIKEVGSEDIANTKEGQNNFPRNSIKYWFTILKRFQKNLEIF